ncbi:MAG: flagellar basal body P-ring protein FlgI [Burkholderiales bacterium]|nr:flagellar basal body P-ring protein FlgI [Burkholderiales bacterium]
MVFNYAKYLILALCFMADFAHAERIRDMASIQGVRENQLIGYGIVVGLDGTGDLTAQTPFTTQSIVSMLQQLGVTLSPAIAASLQLKNVAAVMVTASMPAFVRPGQTLDVTVSSLGNAKSLRGGTLLLTPLKGGDGQVYAMAQGNLLVGGVGASAGGASVQVNHLSVGRISAGATIERAIPSPLGQGQYIALELNATDFTTASRVVDAINKNFLPGTASALDGRMIQVKAPVNVDERVSFLGQIQDIEVDAARTAAKVILNARTGSIVMNQSVTIENCAVAHGSLSVVISSEPSVSQPAAFSGGTTTVTQKSNIDINAEKGALITLKGASLGEVVKALNAVGATPQDLLAILQAMKAAGTLKAELEII